LSRRESSTPLRSVLYFCMRDLSLNLNELESE